MNVRVAAPAWSGAVLGNRMSRSARFPNAITAMYIAMSRRRSRPKRRRSIGEDFDHQTLDPNDRAVHRAAGGEWNQAALRRPAVARLEALSAVQCRRG